MAYTDGDWGQPIVPTPAYPMAAEIAKAMLAMVNAEGELAEAKEIARKVMYRPCSDEKDDYARETEIWNRAADAYYLLLKQEFGSKD